MTRQEIYDRIKDSTKDAVILEEMKKFGFWQEQHGPAALPEELIKREAELVKELNELLEKQRKYQNRELALKEMRAARLQKSREKIAENKKLRIERAEKKAQQWKESKTKDIIYLGENVSKGLNNDKDGNVEKLKQKNLPLINSVEDLAKLMEASVQTLRFLSYNRDVSNVNHYKQFQIPKKTGGFRKISAPMPKLKAAQHWILGSILNKLPIHINAHGFAEKKSIVTNAKPHLNKQVMINIDLKNFFPSVHYPRVKGMFRSLGYNEKIATILALISTESEMDEIEMDGKTYFVKSGDRKLPQGAPTSPAITNYLCRRLDARFTGLAKKYGFEYTRYADDLTFSAAEYDEATLKKFIGFVKKTIKSENFTIHPDKFKILRKGAKKEVTGVVVNEKLSVERKKIKKFKALLYQIEKTGIEGKHWNGSANLLASIKGYANFIHQVDPVKGKIYIDRVNKILAKYQWKHKIVFKAKPKAVTETMGTVVPPAGRQSINTSNNNNKKPWWKFW